MGLWVHLMPSLLHGGTVQTLGSLSTGGKKKKAGILGFKSLCFYSCFMMKMKEKPWGSLLTFAHQHTAVMRAITGHITRDNHQIKGPG